MDSCKQLLHPQLSSFEAKLCRHSLSPLPCPTRLGTVAVHRGAPSHVAVSWDCGLGKTLCSSYGTGWLGCMLERGRSQSHGFNTASP